MKDKYILIAYKPETYIAEPCGCCGGQTFEHDFEKGQFNNQDDLAKEIAKYAIKNEGRTKDEYSGREINGWEIWLIHSGHCISGVMDSYSDGADPCKKLSDQRPDYYDDEGAWAAYDKHTEILSELDIKIDKLWRVDSELKKEKERLEKEAAQKKKEEEKVQKAKKKEASERKRLKELAEKYPEEIQ
tara:strand:+ start:9467 stop:10027 length:561 start_codon:yes stop_codon:yes gene_type:complete